MCMCLYVRYYFQARTSWMLCSTGCGEAEEQTTMQDHIVQHFVSFLILYTIPNICRVITTHILQTHTLQACYLHNTNNCFSNGKCNFAHMFSATATLQESRETESGKNCAHLSFKLVGPTNDVINFERHFNRHFQREVTVIR